MRAFGAILTEEDEDEIFEESLDEQLAEVRVENEKRRLSFYKMTTLISTAACLVLGFLVIQNSNKSREIGAATERLSKIESDLSARKQLLDLTDQEIIKRVNQAAEGKIISIRVIDRGIVISDGSNTKVNTHAPIINKPKEVKYGAEVPLAIIRKIETLESEIPKLQKLVEHESDEEILEGLKRELRDKQNSLKILKGKMEAIRSGKN